MRRSQYYSSMMKQPESKSINHSRNFAGNLVQARAQGCVTPKPKQFWMIGARSRAKNF